VRKIVSNYPENFETFIVTKLIEHDGKFKGIDEHFKDIDGRFKDIEDRFNGVDGRFEGIDATLKRHGDILADHSVQLLKLIEKVDRIDERTAFIPKMYDAMDAFMKEIKESRADRVLLGRKVSDHEERLGAVEMALSVKVEEKAF